MVDLVLATFTALPVALVARAAYGVGTSTGAVTFISLLQTHTPAQARGLVFAGFDCSGSSAGSSSCWWTPSS